MENMEKMSLVEYVIFITSFIIVFVIIGILAARDIRKKKGSDNKKE